MIKTEFQNESHQSISQATHPSPIGVSDTQIQSMLCGLCQRGWLTTDEKQFLDLLAPEKSITFMVLDGRYVHPEDVELFPPSELTASEEVPQGAVLSRHLNHNGMRNQFRNIHTAVINSDSSMTVMLGFICPQPTDCVSTVSDFFSRLIVQFRTAYSSIAGGLSQLREVMTDSSPCVIVDRSSGRMIAANPSACLLLGLPEKKIVGSEFGRIKGLITKRVGGGKLTLRNLTVADLNLTLFTIHPAKESTASQVSGSFPIPGRHFVHRLRNTLTGIRSASELIATMSNSENSADRDELQAIIHTGVDSLGQQADLLDMLMNYTQLQKTSVGIVEEVHLAVRRVTQSDPANLDIRVREQCHPAHVKLVPEAICLLIETALRSHGADRDEGQVTLITCEIGDNNRPVISIESDCSSGEYRAAFDNDWIAYLSCLGSHLASKLTIERMQTRRKLITRIVFTDSRSSQK